MNNLLKTGLMLQIPNLLLVIILALIFIIPLITLSLLFWVLIGTIYGLLNITSIILIISAI